MDTDSLIFSLIARQFWKIIFSQKNETNANSYFGKIAQTISLANATDNFFPRTYCTAHKKNDKREPGLFKEEFKCWEMFSLCSKTVLLL